MSILELDTIIFICGIILYMFAILLDVKSGSLRKSAINTEAYSLPAVIGLIFIIAWIIYKIYEVWL